MSKPKFRVGQVVAFKKYPPGGPKYFRIFGCKWGCIQDEHQWRNGYTGYHTSVLRPLTRRERGEPPKGGK